MENAETTIIEGSSGQRIVTIPKQLAKFTGLEPGMKVEWLPGEENNEIKIKPKEK